jgi:hypothetical protein
LRSGKTRMERPRVICTRDHSSLRARMKSILFPEVG